MLFELGVARGSSKRPVKKPSPRKNRKNKDRRFVCPEDDLSQLIRRWTIQSPFGADVNPNPGSRTQSSRCCSSGFERGPVVPPKPLDGKKRIRTFRGFKSASAEGYGFSDFASHGRFRRESRPVEKENGTSRRAVKLLFETPENIAPDGRFFY
jgi:hypothetical protein